HVPSVARARSHQDARSRPAPARAGAAGARRVAFRRCRPPPPTAIRTTTGSHRPRRSRWRTGCSPTSSRTGAGGSTTPGSSSPPTLTFADQVELWVDDLGAEVRHIGTPAHTTGDAVVWLPEHRILFAGDLVFNGGTPFVLMGSVAGSLTAIERLRRYEATTIVP